MYSAPCLWAPRLHPPGEGQLPGTPGINHDLDSLKTRKFFLVSDLNLSCSQYFLTQSNSLVFKSLLLSHQNKTPVYTHGHGAAMCELGWGKHPIFLGPWSTSVTVLKTPGWLSDLYAPMCAQSFVSSKLVETPEKSRWEVCPQGAAGPVGKATPKPGYKDKEQRSPAPTLLRTCCD